MALVEYNKKAVDCPAHTRDVFHLPQFRDLVNKMSEKLVNLWNETPFDSIVGCGNSGVPLVATLSYKLDIPFATVRKPSEVPRFGGAGKVTGACHGVRFVVIDDLIGTGDTMRNVISSMKALGSAPVGIVLYQCPYKKHFEDVPVYYISNF